MCFDPHTRTRDDLAACALARISLVFRTRATHSHSHTTLPPPSIARLAARCLHISPSSASWLSALRASTATAATATAKPFFSPRQRSISDRFDQCVVYIRRCATIASRTSACWPPFRREPLHQRLAERTFRFYPFTECCHPALAPLDPNTTHISMPSPPSKSVLPPSPPSSSVYRMLMLMLCGFGNASRRRRRRPNQSRSRECLPRSFWCNDKIYTSIRIAFVALRLACVSVGLASIRVLCVLLQHVFA